MANSVSNTESQSNPNTITGGVFGVQLGTTTSAVVYQNFTLATLPTGTQWAYAIVNVSDLTGNVKLAQSDSTGSTWYKVVDGSVAS